MKETEIPAKITEEAKKTGGTVRYFGSAELTRKALPVDKNSTLYVSDQGVYLVGSPELN
jgi:hypothetical protein